MNRVSENTQPQNNGEEAPAPSPPRRGSESGNGPSSQSLGLRTKDIKSPAYMVLSLPSMAHAVRGCGRPKVCTSECQQMERNPLGGGTCCL